MATSILARGARPVPAHIRKVLRLVGSTTDAPLVPSDDLDFLRCRSSASGFRNVYASRHHWVAKVKEGRRLFTIPGSRQPTPQQCAAYVVAWYKARFGALWRRAALNRKRLYWRVRHSARFAGWLLEVWLDGRTQHVMERGANGHVSARPLLFATRPEAVRYARARLPLRLPRPGWRAA